MTTAPVSPADTLPEADSAAVRRAISSTSRPPRASGLSAALTFGWRGMLKVKHVPEQLLDVTITPVMFVLMFTYLFGGAIAGSTAEYLDYILPGILVMSVLFTTVYSGVALIKRFGDVLAVDGVDLTVPRGSVYGVLGPNGAGKTTTIRMLATLTPPDAGTARVLGRDIAADADGVRSVVSLTGQLASVDEDLTGRENLVLLGRLLGLKRAAAKERAAELLDAFGLTDAGGRLVKGWSGGMRRRLDIAASIVVTPELMFLDEPTTGLDPRSRNQVWEIVRALVAEGTTILLCTQYLEEADQLADGIAVIDRGRVIAEGTPAQLKASVGSAALKVRLLVPQQRAEAEQVLSRRLGAVTLEPDPAALSVSCSDTDRAAAAMGELAAAGVRIADFSLNQPTLDEVFLALTGHAADAVPAQQSAPLDEQDAS